MAEKAAFKIAAPIFFPCGTKVRRTDYLETSDQNLIDLLGRAKGGTVIPVAVRGADSAPRFEEAAPSPQPKEEPAEAPEIAAEAEPDWEFMTIPRMRTWLDQAGVKLPTKRSGKAKHEKLCRDAWKAGTRPNPLWGLTGGPQPSAGIGCPPETLERLSEAVAECERLGLGVPVETQDRLADLAQLAEAGAAE